MSELTYFSGFAGIGGFDLGIERVIPESKCVGISEVDKNAIKIYEKHYPDRINYGDIKKIRPKRIPNFRMFCGGFPCQDISIAGKRRGLCGSRSGLFFEIIQIIREKQPEFIFLENVRGLFSSNAGGDFARILLEMDGCGYDAEWQSLNSKDFGVPQNRQRVFIIGHIRGQSWEPVFPITKSISDINESGGQPRDRLVSNAIDSSYYKGADGKRQLIQISDKNTADAQRIYDPSGIAKTLKGSGGGQGAKTGLYCINSQPRCGDPKRGGTGLLISEDQSFTINRNPHIICDSGISRSKQVRRDVIAPLRANTGAAHNNIVNSVRRLTPLECERL